MKNFSSQPGEWEGVAVPIVLIATGLFLLAGDYAGILSLDRIQNLWPVAVIAIGLAELMATRDRSESELAEAQGERKEERHARQL